MLPGNWTEIIIWMLVIASPFILLMIVARVLEAGLIEILSMIPAWVRLIGFVILFIAFGFWVGLW